MKNYNDTGVTEQEKSYLGIDITLIYSVALGAGLGLFAASTVKGQNAKGYAKNAALYALIGAIAYGVVTVGTKVMKGIK